MPHQHLKKKTMLVKKQTKINKINKIKKQKNNVIKNSN